MSPALWFLFACLLFVAVVLTACFAVNARLQMPRAPRETDFARHIREEGERRRKLRTP